METLILDGRKASEEIRMELVREVKELNKKGKTPKLVFITVGDNPASKSYVRAKERACVKVGIVTENKEFKEDVETKEVVDKIKELNENDEVDGIVVQLPLPKKIDKEQVLNAISINKDVDCLNPLNLGYLMIKEPIFYPNTPMAIIELLKFYGIKIEGSYVVILGRGKTVGVPLVNILLKKGPYGNATVTVCHTKTRNLKDITSSADILVSAIGVPGFVKGDLIKENAVIVDVGINVIEGKIVGDVDANSVIGKAKALSPVPGGVGPMTVTMLLKNVIKAAKRNVA